MLTAVETTMTPISIGKPGQKPGWYSKANCHGIDPEIFYPSAEDDASEAKAICHACAVRIPCLEYALATRERDGIWGGASEKERRRLVRQRRRTA